MQALRSLTPISSSESSNQCATGILMLAMHP